MALLDLNDVFDAIEGDIKSRITSEKEKELIRYRNGLGTGYKRNLFLVNFLFYDNKLVNDILSSGNIVREKLSDINGDVGATLSGVSDIAGVGNIIGNVVGDITKKTFEGIRGIKSRWKGLSNTIQLPEVNLEESAEAFKFQKYAKILTKGPVTVGVINDQWNVNYTFWREYISRISNGRRLLYPDEYMFTLEVQTRNTTLKEFQTYKFTDCFVNKLPDLDYGFATTDQHTFALDVSWRDYTVKTIPVPFKDLKGTKVATDEIENSLRV